MSNKFKNLKPVAISGVGGSGTRVIAQMLMNLGYYMGSDLNSANDNLWFSLLFCRPNWFINPGKKNRKLISKGLKVFEKVMTGSCLSAGELVFIARASLERAHRDHDLWPFKRIWTILQPKIIDKSKYIGWGWKEPITHIYVEYLREHFKELKFIHVIRNGLDMAYSKNKAQLRSWGWFFGVDIPNSAKLLPKAALEYWIKANLRAIAIGEEMGDEKFLLVNFDNLCVSPESEVKRILSFLQIETSGAEFSSLCMLPKKPKSCGRYKQKDLSIFNPEDIMTVLKLGFTADATNLQSSVPEQ